MKYLTWLSLVIMIPLVFINCGNEPPEEFYNGTPEDDSLINNLLAQYPYFLKTDDILLNQYINVKLKDISPESLPASDSFFRGESILVKQHVDSLCDKIASSARFKDLWYTKDTTCTVYLFDTFKVVRSVHFDVEYRGFYFYPPGDTDRKLDSLGIDSTGGYRSYDTLTLEGLRHLYVEPVKEKVWDEDAQDSVWKVKEPREWLLKRISYGNYAIPNRGASIPYISRAYLTAKSTGKTDTIWAVNYDTLTYPHAMNRLRHIDSLLEYTNGDTLTIDLLIGGTIPESLCTFFAQQDGKKVQLLDGTGKIQITGSGVTNLVIEAIVTDAFYYVKPASPVLARFWLIPIRVK
ncbi:MAG: hypothetical protein ABIL39_06045 [candidate division WOR-3 bacterium]